ncbi:MAG: IspD/TarI family cytidylyltransferase [Verrucomicrobiota bacterium]|nr:IspD/TarI family cytidylyltransferase [Verrucomicrobiota bacterium]
MNILHTTGVVLLASGNSTRFGNKNKLLQKIDGIPLFCHNIIEFSQKIPPERLILVVPPNAKTLFEEILVKQELENTVKIVFGGEKRQDSALSGLKALPKNTKIVALQDSARPFVSIKLLAECAESANHRGTGIAAHPIVDTIKIATSDMKIQKTLDRDFLWAVETPQAFMRTEIISAYEYVNKKKIDVTDDATAMEYAGKNVFLVKNTEKNDKITYLKDL